MISKFLLKSGFSITISLLIFHSNAYAYTCPNSDNPEIVSADCTQIVVRDNKSAITVNGGVTVSDGGVGSSYGPVSITYPGYGVNVGTLTNNGTISNSNGGSFNGIEIADGSSVTNLVNNGTISTMASSSYAGLKVVGSITTLTNNGTISGSTGANGIQVSSNGNIGTLFNSTNGQINAGSGSVAILISGGGYPANIGTITNLGIIQGIRVQSGGSVGTLNNLQNGLTFTGNLPSNYNVIINSSSSYGRLTSATNNGTQTAFGIDMTQSNLSAGSSSYSSVLSGISSGNLRSTSGTSVGFVTANWNLVAGSVANQWDLNVNSVAIAPVVPGAAGQDLIFSFAAAYNSNCSSGSGQNRILSNGKSYCENATQLTAAQAVQIGLQANAEGYSSNRTIRLEQMNSVSNTVLDRIDSPAGKGTNTTNRVQLDDGRYLWGDIGGSRGNVNSYNNLASFGYNLVDVLIGGDLGRDSQKSYGVFGGVGYSDMTNSQTVVQSFNSTSYYLGGYGSYYLPDNLKLSGVGGYVYSVNNSSRSLPSVAGFTGGNGTDSYASNGFYAAAKVSKDYVINDSFTLVPFAGQSYAQFWTKGVTETGGGDFNVSIASATSYSTVSFAGLDLVIPLVKGVKDPLSLITFYKFGYDWFANTNAAHSVTATYTNLPIASQTYVGANMGPVSQQIGVGLQGAISKDVSARIGAVAAFNTNGQEYGGGAEVRFKF